MNYYDKEINAIEDIQHLSRNEIAFVNTSFSLRKYFRSIWRERVFKGWIDNSSKNSIPPDFYSDEYNYMLEVMRFDDYELTKNHPNVLESRLYKRIENERRKNGVSTFKELNVKVMIVPNYYKASQNSYELYCKNFERVYLKHAKKISQYRKNFPGYKLGFLLIDESPGYVESKLEVSKDDFKPGDMIKNVRLHLPYLDERFVKIIKASDIDFLIWYMPYKNMTQNHFKYPYCAVVDVKKLRIKSYRCVNYDSKKLICLEV